MGLYRLGIKAKRYRTKENGKWVTYPTRYERIHDDDFVKRPKAILQKGEPYRSVLVRLENGSYYHATKGWRMYGERKR